MKRVWYGGKEYSDYEPHYPESEEVEGTERISLDLDADIYIDKNGNWEYNDLEYPWAKPYADMDVWYTESPDYPSIELCDTSEAVEYVDSLLEPLLPFASGHYHVSGKVELVFEVSDIIRYYEYSGQRSRDEDDEDFYTNDAKIEFQFGDSSIEDFVIEQL